MFSQGSRQHGRLQAPRHRAGVTVLALALALTGCQGGSTGAETTSARLDIVTGFYASSYLAQRIGGDRVSVTTLTAPGAEPHDLELTARQVADLTTSDLVVTLTGFQPAVDEGVIASAAPDVLDLGPAVGVDITDHDHTEGEDETSADLAHDPHFWLDPDKMALAAAAVAGRLSALDPSGAATYSAQLASLTSDLDALSEQIRERVRGCAQSEMVVSHAAYGHLAAIAGLTQHALTPNPESDPSSATLARITDLVRERGITTIYTEPLASPRVAEVVAAETGARTAVLDPIEGVSEQSAAPDYLGLMRANIDALAAGQECSP